MSAERSEGHTIADARRFRFHIYHKETVQLERSPLRNAVPEAAAVCVGGGMQKAAAAAAADGKRCRAQRRRGGRAGVVGGQRLAAEESGPVARLGSTRRESGRSCRASSLRASERSDIIAKCCKFC